MSTPFVFLPIYLLEVYRVSYTRDLELESVGGSAENKSVNINLEILAAGASAVEIIEAGTVDSYQLGSGDIVTIHTTGTNAAPGGDPDTGDMNGAARWLWMVIVAAVVMTGCAFTIERKKQKQIVIESLK